MHSEGEGMEDQWPGWPEKYNIGIDMGNGKDYTAVTLSASASPPCPHVNGWYNSIPARFWGRRRVFVCTDCGDILEPVDKKERV